MILSGNMDNAVLPSPARRQWSFSHLMIHLTGQGSRTDKLRVVCGKKKRPIFKTGDHDNGLMQLLKILCVCLGSVQSGLHIREVQRNMERSRRNNYLGW